VAVSIHAVSPALIAPPVTACAAGRNSAPRTLTAATSRKGSADNSRIRSVLRLTVAKVIGRAPPFRRHVTRTVPYEHRKQTAMSVCRAFQQGCRRNRARSARFRCRCEPGEGLKTVWYDGRMSTVNSFGTRAALAVGGRTFQKY